MNYRDLEKQLDEELRNLRSKAIERYKILCTEEGLDRSPTLHSFHAVIGMHNTSFVDSIRLKFETPNDFIAKWLHGLRNKYGNRKEYNYKTNSYIEPMLIKIMNDELLRNYTFIFLERNFYRNYFARTRAKPSRQLWTLWFGDNKLIWGLIIAPAYRKNQWTNDVSEVRRVNYKYWTIGHIMHEGLINPESRERIKFTEVGQFYAFYESILKRISNSKYEKGICDRYISYLKNSTNIMEEPFLIPEIRYAGLEDEHKYRIDFSVLNIHTEKLIGFELSPHSTHMAISGITTKNQKQLNEELKIKWANEMEKRNKYFDDFGITVKTYTDNQLENLDECFNDIKTVLQERNIDKISFEEELKHFMK
ncbi:MAG: topoisomerase II [Bacillota bacterium]